MIASEVRRCSDQWNPLKIAFDRPHEADFPEALMKLSWRERKLVLRDMWNFIVLFKEFKWGRQIAAAALQRPLFGGYPISMEALARCAMLTPCSTRETARLMVPTALCAPD
jgi:hypothetical protein